MWIMAKGVSQIFCIRMAEINSAGIGNIAGQLTGGDAGSKSSVKKLVYRIMSGKACGRFLRKFMEADGPCGKI